MVRRISLLSLALASSTVTLITAATRQQQQQQQQQQCQNGVPLLLLARRAAAFTSESISAVSSSCSSSCSSSIKRTTRSIASSASSSVGGVGGRFSTTTTGSSTTMTRTTASARSRSGAAVVVSLRGGGFDGEVSDLVDDAYGWCMALGQPSALIAGAVVGTIYENIATGNLDLLPEDSRVTKFKKRLTGTLLISAFGLEIMSIFVTTVTGTMLLSRPLHDMDHLVPIQLHTTPLQFLEENFEFEYLTARITYLQGLMNWLVSIALSHLIPRMGESYETKIMNRFITSAFFATIAVMMAFYNQHLTFHANYFETLSHWITCIIQKYYWKWPPNPMALIYIPATLSTLYWGFKGFFGDTSRSPRSKNKHKKQLLIQQP